MGKVDANIIFVIGVEHSGTTILYRMLAKHPEVCWFSQYSMRGGEVPSRFKVPFYNAINKIGAKLFPITWKKRFGLYEKLLPSPSEPHKIWKYLLSDEKQFFDESDFDKVQAEDMRKLVKKECNAWRKDILVTKLPRLTRAVAVLKQAFSEAHFVHIVRDGRAVALSNKSKFARHADSEMQALKDSAQYWRDVVEYVESQKDDISDRYTEIRYEDMCKDVHGTLKYVMSDIDLPSDSYDFSEVPGKLTATNDKHFKRCSRKEKEVLNNKLGSVLDRYEYKPFSLR